MEKKVTYKCSICGKVFENENEDIAWDECSSHENNHQTPSKYDRDKVLEQFKINLPCGYETYHFDNINAQFKYSKGSSRPTTVYLFYENEDGTFTKVAYRSANPNIITEGKVKDEDEDEDK